MVNHALVSEFIETTTRLIKKFKHKKIVLDFTEVNKVFSSPCVQIAGYIQYFKSTGIEFEFIGVNPYLESTHFHNPLIPDPAKLKSTRSYFDKVWTFHNSDEVFSLVTNIIRTLRTTVECEKGVIEACDWGINEIMDNVIQHSETKKGFVMAQINKKTKNLNMCIFDYGVGIYNTMKGPVNKPRNEVDAISLSLQEGRKGYKSIGQGNGMWGLYNIVNENVGHLNIISGTAGLFFRNKKTTTITDLTVLNFKTGRSTSINFHINLNKETLLTNAIKGFTFPSLYLENLEDDRGRIIFKIADVSSGTGTRESAIAIRNELMNIFRDSNKPIIVDFQNIGLVSSSFADELVGKLIVELGFFQYQAIFTLINMNSTIQSILHRAVTQRLYEEYLKSIS